LFFFRLRIFGTFRLRIFRLRFIRFLVFGVSRIFGSLVFGFGFFGILFFGLRILGVWFLGGFASSADWAAPGALSLHSPRGMAKAVSCRATRIERNFMFALRYGMLPL
jgi:hypothetical protein